MTATILIPARYIAALRQFADPRNLRPVCQSLCVELSRGGAACVFASDGFIMGCFRVPGAAAGGARLDHVLIPVELLAHVKNGGDVEITVGPVVKGNEFSRPVRVAWNGGAREGITQDNRAFDWRRMIARAPSGELAQYRADLVARLGKAYGIAAGPRKRDPAAYIGHNGNHGALVVFDGVPDFVGSIAPVNAPAHETPLTPAKPPEWACHDTD